MKGNQTIMEFTNEIYFDKNLIENNTVKISYTGKLFREFSSEVYIVFGYGPNWDNTQEQKMILTEDCFYTNINITGIETFNFCFRNNYNIWDNNNTFNYIAPIYPKTINNVSDTSSETSDNSISIESIDISNDTTLEQNSENLESSSEESNDCSAENFQNEADNVFTELLESLLNDNNSFASTDTSTHLENSFELHSTESIDSVSTQKLNEIFDEVYSQDLENSLTSSNIQNITDSDLDALFNKIFNSEDTEETTNSSINDELEELMDNILNSIIESNSINDSIIEELDSSIDKVAIQEIATTTNKITSEPIAESITEPQQTENISDSLEVTEQFSEELMPATISTSKIDRFFDASYKFLQNIGVACKKIGALIKMKALEYGFIKEDK